ncbi:MAG TPA: flagellar protein FlaG [Bacillota bacterium]|nr:flagellar protein FlaG [Bacillota bacterium]
MHIGKISAELPTMQSGSRSQDTQNERQEKELAKNVPTTDENLLNKNSVKEITTQLNEFLEPVKTNLKFEYHEDLNDYYVTIVNSSTKEVIKEIPPKKMLDMYASMIEYMGLLIDERI